VASSKDGTQSSFFVGGIADIGKVSLWNSVRWSQQRKRAVWTALK